MDKLEAAKELAKFHYSQILVGDEFIEQDDGAEPVRNMMFRIADAFEIKVPIQTFQPRPEDPKGPLPNHSKEWLSLEINTPEWTAWCEPNGGACPCWNDNYTGIAPMQLLDAIAWKHDIHSAMFGRGSAYRNKIGQLIKLFEEPEIVIDLSKGMVEVPLDNNKEVLQ